MSIGEALKEAISSSNRLTTQLGEKAEVLDKEEIVALIQLGILYELRAIRLVLQSKE